MRRRFVIQCLICGRASSIFWFCGREPSIIWFCGREPMIWKPVYLPCHSRYVVVSDVKIEGRHQFQWAWLQLMSKMFVLQFKLKYQRHFFIFLRNYPLNIWGYSIKVTGLFSLINIRHLVIATDETQNSMGKEQLYGLKWRIVTEI